MAEKVSLVDVINAARGRQGELAEKRAVLQEQLHAKLAETFGAEQHPEVIALREKIKALQAEKYDLDQGLSAAAKASGAKVLVAE